MAVAFRVRVLIAAGALAASTAPVAVASASVGSDDVARPGPGTVALTFDDGPHPVWTMRLLDLLDRHGVRATFFVVGEAVEAYPEIVREMASRGHSVQNHTWSHPFLTRLPDIAIEHQFQHTTEAIERLTARTPTCMRPPYMDTSARVRRIAETLGLEQVLWDRDPQEWRTRSAALTIQYLLTDTVEGDVILLHDVMGAMVLPTLDVVIPALRDRGLRFVTICDTPGAGVPHPRRITAAGEMR